MKARLITIAAVALGLTSVVALADVSNGAGSDRVTAQDAQALTDRDLAHLILGVSGSLILNVDRPVWGSPPRFQAGSWPPPGPPPLDRLVFYGRPVVTGSQFGICGSKWITVEFDENGRVQDLEAETRYGVEGPIDAKPGSWTYEQSGAICGKVTNTKHYFPAPGPEEALVIALYSAKIVKEASRNKSMDFTCNHRPCGKIEKIYLANLNLNVLSHARIVDCSKSKLRNAECYELIFNEGKLGGNPQTLRIVGTDFMNRLAIDDVTLEFGVTLE